MGLKLYVDQIDSARPEQLRQLVRLVKEQRYQVAVELGCCLDFGPMDDTAGKWSAQHELAKIEKFYSASLASRSTIRMTTSWVNTSR